MNGDWVAWHRDPQLYVEKWRLLARLVRELAPNVALVWTPFFVGDDSVPLERYYPGDDYVDWVGIIFYSDY
jgi:beta-mannanase